MRKLAVIACSLAGASAALAQSFTPGANVSGPGSSTINDIALFNNTTGNLLKDSGASIINGTLTLAPVPTLNQGLVISQTGPNTGSQGTTPIQYNSISVNDGANLSGAGAQSTPLIISHILGSNTQGEKYALWVSTSRNVPTSTISDQIGGFFYAQSSVSNGGTNTGAGSKGGIFALNPVISILPAATNYTTFAGEEIDVGVQGTSKERFGLLIANSDIGRGAVTDAAFAITSGANVGSFKNALLLTQRSGAGALGTDGCVICTDGGAQTIATGIDLSPFVITGNFLTGFNSQFTVNGAGTVLTLGGQVALTTAAWTTYTPVMTCGAGSVVSYTTQTGRYRAMGKTVAVSVVITVSNAGTCSGLLSVSLPVNGGPANVYILNGRNGTNGKQLQVSAVGGGSTMLVAQYDNSNPTPTDGLVITGVYESN